MRKCLKCGSRYDSDKYGENCLFCNAIDVNLSESKRMIPCVYGPPPIEHDSYQKLEPILYGPNYDMSAHNKRFSWKFIILFICAIFGGLLIGLSYKAYSLLYGPSPIQGQHNIDSIIKPQKLEPE